MKGNRYTVFEASYDTYFIMDKVKDKMFCVCTNFDDFESPENMGNKAKKRAKKIAKLLNEDNSK